MQDLTATTINEDVRHALRDAYRLAELRAGREGARRASHPIPGADGRSLASGIAALRERIKSKGAAEPACCAA